MQTHREEFLHRLQMISPGLGKGDFIAQGDCFVFHEGLIRTFNDEVACSIDSPLPIEGAVPAEPLLALLNKLKEEHVKIDSKNELRITGKSARAGITIEAEIRLPIKDIVGPTDWKPLPAEFAEGIEIVRGCAGRKEAEFMLTCVHITPNWVEACDDVQISRFELEMPIEAATLVRASSLKDVVGYDMTEVSETEGWLHFRNPSGLVYSCRRYLMNYPDLTAYLQPEGENAPLPPGLAEALKCAEIFPNGDGTGNVRVKMKRQGCVIEGRGHHGWYQQKFPVEYSGRDIEFAIDPKVLQRILTTTQECRVSENRLYVEHKRFLYASCLAVE